MSTGSDTDRPSATIDEKKRKRMQSNRESARRSRMKKQKHMEDLVNEKVALERNISENYKKYDAVFRSHLVLDSENKILEAEKMRLSNYYKYLSLIAVNFNKGYEFSDKFPQVMGHHLKPLQGQDSTQPMVTSGIFRV